MCSSANFMDWSSISNSRDAIDDFLQSSASDFLPSYTKNTTAELSSIDYSCSATEEKSPMKPVLAGLHDSRREYSVELPSLNYSCTPDKFPKTSSEKQSRSIIDITEISAISQASSATTSFEEGPLHSSLQYPQKSTPVQVFASIQAKSENPKARRNLFEQDSPDSLVFKVPEFHPGTKPTVKKRKTLRRSSGYHSLLSADIQDSFMSDKASNPDLSQASDDGAASRIPSPTSRADLPSPPTCSSYNFSPEHSSIELDSMFYSHLSETERPPCIGQEKSFAGTSHAPVEPEKLPTIDLPVPAPTPKDQDSGASDHTFFMEKELCPIPATGKVSKSKKSSIVKKLKQVGRQLHKGKTSGLKALGNL